jgi:hypothetical protein
MRENPEGSWEWLDKVGQGRRGGQYVGVREEMVVKRR